EQLIPGAFSAGAGAAPRLSQRRRIRVTFGLSTSSYRRLPPPRPPATGRLLPPLPPATGRPPPPRPPSHWGQPSGGHRHGAGVPRCETVAVRGSPAGRPV